MTDTSSNQKKTDAEQKNVHQKEAEDTSLSLEQELAQAKESELRAKADYHNLVRRSQQERQQLIKLATKSLIADLVQPLEHLALASQELNDAGLNMVVTQFWQALDTHGLQEINPVGQAFDIETMEAVETQDEVDEDNSEVKSVVKRGYRLNGEVIQHAKVVVGKK